MKLKTILVILLLSQILFGESNEGNSTTDNQRIEHTKTAQKEIKTFSPKFLSMAKTTFKLFEPYKSTKKEAPFIEEKIYPLGYSNDGKIAYIIEYYTGHIETYIQDLISDEIIWQEKAKDVNFKSFWEKNQEKIEAELNTHNINPFKRLWLKKEPISYKNKLFSLSSKVQKFHAKDLNLDLVESSTISLHSETKGEKIINKKEYDQSSYLLDRKAIGFIALGENNKRTAVVIATIYHGEEETPNIISYEIIGANLAMGFSNLTTHKN